MDEDEGNGRRQQTWRTYLSANVQLLDRLDQDLQQRSNLNLTDYEILSVLAASPDRRLRMSELARQVLVSRSRLTYRVDRLTEVNFVTREECTDDRRGLWAILSPVGLEALESAASGHQLDIETWFFDIMTDDELEVLGGVVQRMEAKLNTNRQRPTS